MTAQRSDTIIVNDNPYVFYQTPLEQYWKLHNNKPGFCSFNTSLNRGYYSDWKIENKMLFLISFYGETFLDTKEFLLAEAQKLYSLNDIFPASDGKVFASWFTGEITLQMGNQVDYSHSGIGSIYEFNTTLILKDGVVVDSGLFALD